MVRVSRFFVITFVVPLVAAIRLDDDHGDSADTVETDDGLRILSDESLSDEYDYSTAKEVASDIQSALQIGAHGKAAHKGHTQLVAKVSSGQAKKQAAKEHGSSKTTNEHHAAQAARKGANKATTEQRIVKSVSAPQKAALAKKAQHAAVMQRSKKAARSTDLSDYGDYGSSSHASKAGTVKPQSMHKTIASLGEASTDSKAASAAPAAPAAPAAAASVSGLRPSAAGSGTAAETVGFQVTAVAALAAANAQRGASPESDDAFERGAKRAAIADAQAVAKRRGLVNSADVKASLKEEVDVNLEAFANLEDAAAKLTGVKERAAMVAADAKTAEIEAEAETAKANNDIKEAEKEMKKGEKDRTSAEMEVSHAAAKKREAEAMSVQAAKLKKEEEQLASTQDTAVEAVSQNNAADDAVKAANFWDGSAAA